MYPDTQHVRFTFYEINIADFRIVMFLLSQQLTNYLLLFFKENLLILHVDVYRDSSTYFCYVTLH